MSEWRKHTGTERPAELAAAQIVRARIYTLNRSAFSTQHMTAASVPWRRCDAWCPALDPDGLPYVSAEGLEELANYVATDPDGAVWQYSYKPKLGYVDWLGKTLWGPEGESFVFYAAEAAPSTHAIPGDPENSLAKVWRQQ